MKTTLYLLTENPDGDRSSVPLQPDNCLFAGSGPGCHVSLSGTNISSIHCLIWMDSDESVFVQDRGTAGNTIMNGQPIEIAHFKLEDEIRIGEYRLSLTTLETVDTKVASTEELPGQENPDISPVVIEAQDILPETITGFETPDEVDDSSTSPSTPALDEGWDFESAEEENIPTSFEDEPNFHENELLRMEVEQLRFELAQRDAQQPLIDCVGHPESDENHSPQATERLVLRLEELLEELQSSDDRIQQLEELLRLSDSATQAEQQERRQLEAWVAGIEDRVCQKEAESVAELAQANQQFQFAQTRIRDLEARLEKVINSNDHHDTEAVKEFQQQLERAQNQYQQTIEENIQLKGQLKEQSTPGRSQEEFEAVEQKLLQLEVSTTRERAEMARLRVELERLMHEVESKSKSQVKLSDADSRVRAMRLHLREIHEEDKLEKQEKKDRSLGARISQLFSRTTLNN